MMIHLFSSNSYLRFKVLITSFVLSSTAIFGQNLVINPSFEDVNVGSLNCSWYTTIAQFNSAINNWTLPTGGSTDIFNTALATSCYCSPFSTHTSSPGQQAPRTGNGFCNIVTYGNGGCSPWREYLQGQLSAPMVVGQAYEVELWVTLADKMSKGTNNIGIKFSTNPYLQGGNCGYYTTPDLNYLGPIILDKANWVQILFTYTPTVAGLDNFIIGNFYNDVATSTQAASGVTTGNTIRYFVDDVRIEPVNPLPVEMSAFDANCEDDGVLLQWTTITENNNDYFTIEKSTNGSEFSNIAQLDGAGNSNVENDYRFKDVHLSNDVSYYRIKQTDFDGKSSYSKVVTSDCGPSISVFPNPTSSDLFVKFDKESDEAYAICITDMIGTIVSRETISSEKTGTYMIGNFSDLSTGVYVVQVVNSQGEVIILEKIIKK